MNFNDDDHNFTFRFDSSDGKKRVEMDFSELYIQDILNQFKSFLQACDYEINGNIEIVEDEDEEGLYREQPKFDFSNIPNNNYPFGTMQNDTLDSVPETVTISMPGTMGAPNYTWK